MSALRMRTPLLRISSRRTLTYSARSTSKSHDKSLIRKGRRGDIVPSEISGFARRVSPASTGYNSQHHPSQTNRDGPSEQDVGRGIISGQEPALYQGQTSSQNDQENSLIAEINIPEDSSGILQPDHPATSILSNSSIVVQRQIEMMNVFLGFEQANRYVIMDPQGTTIGYLAEQEHGMANMMARQMLRTHRSFTTHVFNQAGQEVLRVR